MEARLPAPRETVVLTLKNLVYRHTEFMLLGDFLVQKYGFRKIEEVEHEISGSRETTQVDRKDILFEEELRAPILLEEIGTKYSSHKIFDGNYLDVTIRACIMGDIIRTESLVEISNEERYPIYTAEYQMVKLVSESGYALQQFIEKMSIDLGMKIESMNWSFHRSIEA